MCDRMYMSRKEVNLPDYIFIDVRKFHFFCMSSYFTDCLNEHVLLKNLNKSCAFSKKTTKKENIILKSN